jgi:hypothetical protein
MLTSRVNAALSLALSLSQMLSLENIDGDGGRPSNVVMGGEATRRSPTAAWWEIMITVTKIIRPCCLVCPAANGVYIRKRDVTHIDEVFV